MFDPGTVVRIDNPASMFHGQRGEVECYICPAKYGAAFLRIRIQRDSDSILVPCCTSELVVAETA